MLQILGSQVRFVWGCYIINKVEWVLVKIIKMYTINLIQIIHFFQAVLSIIE